MHRPCHKKDKKMFFLYFLSQSFSRTTSLLVVSLAFKSTPVEKRGGGR